MTTVLSSAAVLLQPVQEAAYLAVDLGNGGVVADIAGANLLGGRLEGRRPRPSLRCQGWGWIGRDVRKCRVFEAGGQIRVMGFGLIG